VELGLAGKRALVTGFSSGLGEAIAGLLAREGAQVVVHGRDVDRARAVVDAIIADGGAATMAIGDLRSDEQAEGVAAAAIADGPVDILVNNAGTYHHVDWRSAGPRVWAKTYDTNVPSAVRIELLPVWWTPS
jgi:NAD(P)-dependent dehydrogenase (short-subunit alcohol dehydrogenase family)